MRRNAMIVCLLMATTGAFAQAPEKDSLQTVGLQEVEVIATRATAHTPVAYTNLSKEQLKKANTGVDMPYLLTFTPSVLTTSDAGAGIGYTSIRVRGTDATRINVTTNGIPMNDAESHSIFWVNTPDFASSLQDVQIQRGAGTSTNGAGAFGASINMQTQGISPTPYAEFSGSYGSFNTHKETVKAGTGIINGHWGFDARLSNVSSDGYIDRASVGLNAYFLQGGYYTDNTSIRLITFANKERTYHAWNYASKEEMEQYGRRYNSCGLMYEDEKGVQHFYEDQTDNYIQKHYQLLLNHRFNSQWNMNIGLHYTKGDGYYQEYKTRRTLVEYGLSPFVFDDKEVTKSDLVRKKAMDNKFGGGIFSFTYRGDHLQATLGGALNRYDGDHFGRVLWVKSYVGDLNPDTDYYFNNATKNDGNIYLKANYELAKGVNAYMDLQYRHICYKIDGTNDKYNWLASEMQRLDIHEDFGFFNPKAGLSWQINPHHRLFVSFSEAQKEPTRNNYTDGRFDEHPKPERLLDYELGYTFAGKTFQAGANLYYMDYKDQLVLTGELNEIGEAMASNVPDSYRMGVELMANLRLPCGFTWNINATLSKNRVKNFTETLFENEEAGTEAWVINHGNTPLSFSPDFILNNRFGYTYKGFEASLQSQYVSKQYMSNAKQEECTLDAYFVSNLALAYTFKLPKVKSMTVGCTLYNLFNEKYENNGYAGSGYYYDGDRKVRYNYAGYAAQAGTHLLAHVSINF
ncbi:TonB-dependent receptor [uncultured Bacteroides sp.]|jgi:Outer membrane receptor proteins, mostly Fe transport|uniref:TonB-dependent receptor n=1 Tax=uncultured Bacteroides sp. TaxID=162156 RepID=UPI002621F168|nr:TonB-dependent receptor [uncultured Bacteroides sp.]